MTSLASLICIHSTIAKEDYIKVHLSIDESQEKEKAYWYRFDSTYTTEGHTGWYCMPQLSDDVNLYFPISDERKGYVRKVNVTDSENEKTQNPDNKYLGVIHGNEFAFTPTDITITEIENSMYISLDENIGVEIRSNQDIKINTGYIGIESKTIEMKSADKIVAATRNASIIEDKEVHFKTL